MTDIQTDVAIVGGGFSGAMLAARLAEVGLRSAVIDRTGRHGLGVAYATPFDGHLLNVRSARMSALEDAPNDFVHWLQAHAPDHADPSGFAPRRLYGLYVRDRFQTALASGLIEPLTAEATALGDKTVRLADGRLVQARSIVMATGNPAPQTASSAPRVIADPWAPGALDAIAPDDPILILGTGLTMVDMIVWLDGRGWRGAATALSRRGLKPRPHGDAAETAAAPASAMLAGPTSRRLRAARTLATDAGWRSMMEGLRPITAEVWMAAGSPVRARWVRHLRPWWDVHRHRIASVIANELEKLETEGRLAVRSGRIIGVDANQAGVVLRWVRRGQPQAPLAAAWLIDCTGPGHDPARDPLTGPLIAQGRARLDPLRLGLELDADGRVLDAQGRTDPDLFVLGPPARAAFWETVAVPDIRRRIEKLAQTLIEDRPVGSPQSGQAGL